MEKIPERPQPNVPEIKPAVEPGRYDPGTHPEIVPVRQPERRDPMPEIAPGKKDH